MEWRMEMMEVMGEGVKGEVRWGGVGGEKEEGEGDKENLVTMRGVQGRKE